MGFFFIIIFSQKLRGRVTRNIEKKHMALFLNRMQARNRESPFLGCLQHCVKTFLVLSTSPCLLNCFQVRIVARSTGSFMEKKSIRAEIWLLKRSCPLNLIWLLDGTLSQPSFFVLQKPRGGVNCAPGKNPVSLLRFYSRNFFLKACPKLSPLTQLYFPCKPRLAV